jgi:prepilin-type N-terminal cleavage/methylation domain-containing protein
MQNNKIFFERPVSADRHGFTLIETIVALSLFALGIAATVMVFSSTMKNKAYTLEMGRSSFVVARSMGDLTQYIRRARQSDAGSYPIVSASDNDLVIYSDYNKDDKTERLHIYLSNSKVFMGIRKPSTTFPITYAAGDEQTIQLADHIINSASDHLFSYYNGAYPDDPTGNPVPTPADVSEIRLIKLFLKINIDVNRAPDNIQQETFVEVRNLNDYDRIH